MTMKHFNPRSTAWKPRAREQIFGLLPEKLRPKKRKKFKAYDGTNNIFNLAYEILIARARR